MIINIIFGHTPFRVPAYRFPSPSTLNREISFDHHCRSTLLPETDGLLPLRKDHSFGHESCPIALRCKVVLTDGAGGENLRMRERNRGTRHETK